MNKEQFLTELKEYLSILENQEQEDILAEYAQHIDMKMQKGLSEEEAIRDFNPIGQLAAEILEAYHVKPQFSEKTSTGGQWKRKSKTAADAVAHGIGRMSHGVGRAFRWLGGKCRAFGGWIRRLFGGRHSEALENGCRLQERQTEPERPEASGRIRRFGKACGRFLAGLWRWLVYLCIWCLRLMWNMAWLLFALCCAGLAVIMLLGVGVMPVLLVQGYPFIGCFIMCLGGLLCLGALAYGSYGMIVRKGRNRGGEGGNGKEQQTEESGKEACYEQTA